MEGAECICWPDYMCNKNEIKVVNVLLDIDISEKDRETGTSIAKGNFWIDRFTQNNRLYYEGEGDNVSSLSFNSF